MVHRLADTVTAAASAGRRAVYCQFRRKVMGLSVIHHYRSYVRQHIKFCLT